MLQEELNLTAVCDCFSWERLFCCRTNSQEIRTFTLRTQKFPASETKTNFLVLMAAPRISFCMDVWLSAWLLWNIESSVLLFPSMILRILRAGGWLNGTLTGRRQCNLSAYSVNECRWSLYNEDLP